MRSMLIVAVTYCTLVLALSSPLQLGSRLGYGTNVGMGSIGTGGLGYGGTQVSNTEVIRRDGYGGQSVVSRETVGHSPGYGVGIGRR